MSAGYILKEGFAGLNRAKLAAATSVFSLFIAVLLIAVLFRLGFNAYELANVIKQQVEVEVFLNDAGEEDADNFGDLLLQKPGISGIAYISKDSASAVFQQEFGMGAESLSQLNFLPASYRVTMDEELSVAQIDSIVQEIKVFEQVDEVRFNLALLEMIENRTETVIFAGSAIGLFILLVAIILVFNTIRLTIYAKRDLIRAMKLVGATNAFIRRPFLVEGVLQGLIAGGFATVVMYALFSWIIPEFVPQAGVLSWPFGQWYYLVAGSITLAILLGWWGSRLAARKFIKDASIS